MLEIIPMNHRAHQSAFNPFREFYDLDKMFSAAESVFGDKSSLMFRTDVKDNGDSYLIESELPGFDRKDISVDLTDDRLTVSAERAKENTEEDSGKNYILRERTAGSYKRSFEISGVDTENVSAKYENGVLILTLPKKEPKAPVSRQLTIE